MVGDIFVGDIFVGDIFVGDIRGLLSVTPPGCSVGNSDCTHFNSCIEGLFNSSFASG